MFFVANARSDYFYKFYEKVAPLNGWLNVIDV